MRRLAAAVFLIATLVACSDSLPSPPTTSPGTTAPSTGATTGPTTAATTGPTTAPTTASTTGATSGPTSGATSGSSEACAALDDLFAAMNATIPDFDQVKTVANHVIEVAGTLSDQGQAALLGSIGQDAADSAQAFLDGDFQTGANLQNQVLQTIPPARVALGCT